MNDLVLTLCKSCLKSSGMLKLYFQTPNMDGLYFYLESLIDYISTGKEEIEIEWQSVKSIITIQLLFQHNILQFEDSTTYLYILLNEWTFRLFPIWHSWIPLNKYSCVCSLMDVCTHYTRIHAIICPLYSWHIANLA